jgi:hypothetical protein
VKPPTLRDRLLALETRVQALENRPASLRYLGIWDPSRPYDRDDGVTVRGSLWIATAPSRGTRPGTDEAATVWKLAVKEHR